MIDEEQRRFVMYYHGILQDRKQVTRVATSTNGIDFEAREEIVGMQLVHDEYLRRRLTVIPREMIEFADRICPQGIKYVINTLSHADHTYGSYLFPEAKLVAHDLTRQMLQQYGIRGLEEAKEHTPELRAVQIRPPTIGFNPVSSNNLTLPPSDLV